MRNKLLIVGLGLLITSGANAAPKGANELKWNLSRMDWSGAQWGGMVSYYNPAMVDQTYFGEQVYYGEENYGVKVAQKMKEKYGIDLRNIIGMCSKSGGKIGSYVKDGKQPKSHKDGDYCWCGLESADGHTPWFLLSAGIGGTIDGVKKNHCARNCAYSCAEYMYEYLFPQSDLLIDNAHEIIEYTVNMHNN